MTILHVCNGWVETNGAAVIALHIVGEQRKRGHVVVLRRWASWRELRTADEVWIHCGWRPCLWWASLVARRSLRMPEACFDPVRLAYHGWKKRLAGPIERWTLRRAVAAVATCAAEADWIRAYEPRVREIRFEDIKRFFDLAGDACASPHRPLHLLYLGRPHPLKGVRYLRAAVRQCPGVELREVSGATGADKDAVWDWADALALPTLSDNFGLVVAEALSRGKRVLVTDGAPVWAEGAGYGSRLVYLRGFRDGSDEQRVALLADALRRHFSPPERNDEHV